MSRKKKKLTSSVIREEVLRFFHSSELLYLTTEEIANGTCIWAGALIPVLFEMETEGILFSIKPQSNKTTDYPRFFCLTSKYLIEIQEVRSLLTKGISL